MTSVGRHLVVFLSCLEAIHKVTVKFIKVSHELMCMGRSDINIMVDIQCGVVALVGKEQRNTSRCVRSIVVCELSKGQELSPIVLLVAAIMMEIFLQHLVSVFQLTISLGIITGGEVDLDTKQGGERSEELQGELRTVIASDMEGNAVFGENMVQEQSGNLRGIHLVVSWYHDELLACTVNDIEDRSVTMGWQKLLDQIK